MAASDEDEDFQVDKDEIKEEIESTREEGVEGEESRVMAGRHAEQEQKGSGRAGDNIESDEMKRKSANTSPSATKAKKSRVSEKNVPPEDSVSAEKPPILKHRLFSSDSNSTVSKAPSRASKRPRRRETYVSDRTPIPRGSIMHAILDRIGKLDDSLLVDYPVCGVSTVSEEAGPPDAMANALDNAGNRNSAKIIDPGSTARAIDEPEGHSDPRQQEVLTNPMPVPGRPVDPNRICFRSTVMPLCSPNIPEEMFRVIVVSGKHQNETGFVTEETFGKNSIIKLDDGTKITVSNSHIRTVSSIRSDVVDDPASKNARPLAQSAPLDPDNLVNMALEQELLMHSKLERRRTRKTKS